MGRCIDALVIGPVLFVPEFRRRVLGSGTDQIADYALDLKNFHEG
jgi:hypothetical protein